MRAIPLSQEDVDNAGDLTNATFPDIWRAMGEVDIICLGLPFACEFFQDQLSRLVGLPRIVRDYDAMRASYKSFCQQEVKRNGPLAAKIKEGRFTADLDPYLGFKVQRKLHQAMEVKLQEIISVADSSESEEEEEKKESSSEEEEEEEEEEEPELLAIRLRGQY